MVYLTYPRRWGVLLSVMVCNIASISMGSCLAPVAPLATKYYNIDGDTLDLLFIMTNVLNLIGMLAAIYCVNTYGLRTSVRLGSTGIGIGSIVRLLSTFPSYEANIDPPTKWWVTLTGQMLCALSHAFLMTISTKVSQAWFSEKERIFSTASIVMSSPLGGLIAAVVSTIIVNDDWERIPYLNIYYPALGILGCLLSWCFVTRSAPPTPPSASAEQDIARGKVQLILKDSLVTCKNLVKNPTILCFTVVMGGGYGILQTFGTQLAQIMCVNGYPTNTPGILVAAMILAGVLGAFAIGSRAKQRQRLELYAKTFFCLFSVSLIFFMVALREENIVPGLFIALFVAGFCGIGCIPVVLEICAEEVYPVNPVFPETFIRASESAWGFILVPLGNALHWDPSPHMREIQTCRSKEEEVNGSGLEPWDYTPYFYFLMALQTIGALSFLYFIKPNMNRAKVDQKENTSTEPQYISTDTK